MPTAKMLADSTQSDAALERKKKERHDRHKKSKKEDKPHHHSKRKTKSTFASGSNRKSKKKHKSTTSDKDTETKEGSEDSDLNLSKPLHPIGHYINKRSEMLEQMFHCIQGATLKKALPEILQDLPMKELKQLCLTQLEVMSKKRILRILAGDDPITISSSGTDESADEGGNNSGNVSKRSTVAAQPADSTSSSIDRVEFQPVADSRVLADVSKTSSVVCKPTAEVELGITKDSYHSNLASSASYSSNYIPSDQKLLNRQQIYTNPNWPPPGGSGDLHYRPHPVRAHVSPHLLAYQQALSTKQLDISQHHTKVNEALIMTRTPYYGRNATTALAHSFSGVSTNFCHNCKQTYCICNYKTKPTSLASHQLHAVPAAPTVTMGQTFTTVKAAPAKSAFASSVRKSLPPGTESSQNVIVQTEMEILELGMRARAIKAMLQAASQCNP
ncbi:uncharacterized protein LOC115215684 isoform X1 [Octopus sinensis]|uniref:Uncharacterized protein LOC115215684 isoform X1 n=1 Tax=Octopus sinensis TaxID=2607531 RepID=A0A6P7SS95_9MOLL|nr:uncharacterized protein LOC115215684 isoform X1 [Octopus sinensis]XP_036362103.1 uncharacterized protein LOC115215684 isoform X1 [Octopus sinensis]XP_036362104.1 uncharacterized protein LOC115215684 isoform X1 [Octopus sinensis]XP_036362105.1 uncharacterized protein LOC115215684 isoform X1 [Octopus sinensis]